MNHPPLEIYSSFHYPILTWPKTIKATQQLSPQVTSQQFNQQDTTHDGWVRMTSLLAFNSTKPTHSLGCDEPLMLIAFAQHLHFEFLQAPSHLLGRNPLSLFRFAIVVVGCAVVSPTLSQEPAMKIQCHHQERHVSPVICATRSSQSWVLLKNDQAPNLESVLSTEASSSSPYSLSPC